MQELCHDQDFIKLDSHLKETLTTGCCMSAIYRLRLAAEKYVHVQTKSKYFKATGIDPDFIMATHSIIR